MEVLFHLCVSMLIVKNHFFRARGFQFADLPLNVLLFLAGGAAGIAMLKAIHAQETREAARENAQAVVQKLREMRLKEAAKKVEDGIEETLTYYAFPSEHWLKIRTNNMLERLNREIRRRTRVVGTFPDGESALMLVCARLRHVAGTQWGVKRYMSMKSLEQMDREKHGADCCDLA